MGIAEDVLHPRLAYHRCACVVGNRLRLSADQNDPAARAQRFEYGGSRFGTSGRLEDDLHAPAVSGPENLLCGILLRHVDRCDRTEARCDLKLRIVKVRYEHARTSRSER